MVAEDKIKHFIVGIIIFLLCSLFGLDYVYSLLIVFVAGVGKEIYDYNYPDQHTVESYDVLATIAGPIVIIVFLEVLKWIF